MDALIALAALAAVPVLAGLFLRVNALYVFMSVAAGNLFVHYIADDASLALSMFVKSAHSNQIAQFGVLLAPVVVSFLLLRKTLPKSKFLLHVPLLVANGIALAALAIPLLDSQAQEKVFANQYGNMLRESQDVAVAAAAGLALVLLWTTKRHKPDKKKKHH